MTRPAKEYGVYDLKDNEVCIGIFKNCSHIARTLNLKTNSVHSLISRKKLLKGRYEVIKFY